MTFEPNAAMIPRGDLDIGWRDLLFAVRESLRQRRQPSSLPRRWMRGEDILVCLSVRSGFDLALQVCAFPAGSEVLFSAVTIPHMVRIIEAAGLEPVPVEVDRATCAVDTSELATRITPRTRAIMIAHLFGSRTPMEPILNLARERRLVVFEDCAQAFDGVYQGHPDTDVSLFSFGPIKTATALGGAVLRVRDGQQRAAMHCRQSAYPQQSAMEFLTRVLRCSVLKLLARPFLFGAFATVCRLRGLDLDRVLSSAVRGFADGDLLMRIRRQPSQPLVQLLHRRLGQDHTAGIARRVRCAERLHAALSSVRRPGDRASSHVHWVLPIESRDADGLVQVLRGHGFDATRRASSMLAFRQTADGCCLPAPDMLRDVVFLPAITDLPDTTIDQLGRPVADFESLNCWR